MLTIALLSQLHSAVLLSHNVVNLECENEFVLISATFWVSG